MSLDASRRRFYRAAVWAAIVGVLLVLALPQLRAAHEVYGEVPLSQALVKYMERHGPRLPESWEALDPYLREESLSTGFYHGWIRESFDLAWGIDAKALYRPGSCANGGRPIILPKRLQADPNLPRCFDDGRLAALMKQKGLLSAVRAP
jgi:hypothetical protein